jgi:hypothetical protein
MAICMTAMTSDLYSHGRSDPEYFLPSHTKVEADLNAVSTLPLRRLGHFTCSAFYPAATHLYAMEGITFLRCVDIVDFPIISPDQPFARIPKSFADEHSTIRRLKPGDIVISKVGTPCYAALLSEDMPESAMTRTVLGMSQVDQSIVNPYYLIAFLRSRYGFHQLMRERELTIQYQLTLERTRKVRVFIPDRPIQNSIGDLVRNYYRSLCEGINAYETAHKILESELGLDKVSLQKPIAYTTRFSVVGLSDAFSASRVDAQCFAPDVLFYENWLNGHASCDQLGKLLQGTVKGRQQTEIANGSIDYCSIKHISDRELVSASKCTPPPDTPFAEPNDLLLAITGATIGKIGIVKRYKKLAFSGDLLCLRASGLIDPHYLLLALDHHLGQVQFNRWITGSTNGHLAPKDVARVLVPRLRSEAEAKIAELVKQSLTERRESEQLLEQAKTRVEQLIEEAVQS